MLDRLILPALVVFLVVLVPFGAYAQQAVASDDSVIGTVIEIEGQATITAEGQAPVAAAVNAPVHMNDLVETGPQSRIFILLIDNTQWTLAENAKFKVNEYVFDPDDNTANKGRYSVLQGAFQYVSGLLAKKPNPDVNIATPVGSIGIRGTDFWGGDIDGSYGVHVDEGQVNVANNAGQVLLSQGQGTSVKSRFSAPAPAQAWSPERLQRIRGTVRLKRQELVKQRMAQMQTRHRAMQERFRDWLKKRHPRDGQDTPQDQQMNLQDLKQELQQRREMRRGLRGQ